MTYGRVQRRYPGAQPHGRGRKSLAELVRGEFPSWEGPLIRPFGPPSPQGEKGPRNARLSITKGEGNSPSASACGSSAGWRRR
jgi:hypothetical protein